MEINEMLDNRNFLFTKLSNRTFLGLVWSWYIIDTKKTHNFSYTTKFGFGKRKSINATTPDCWNLGWNYELIFVCQNYSYHEISFCLHGQKICHLDQTFQNCHDHDGHGHDGLDGDHRDCQRSYFYFRSCQIYWTRNFSRLVFRLLYLATDLAIHLKSFKDVIVIKCQIMDKILEHLLLYSDFQLIIESWFHVAHSGFNYF